MTQQAVGPGFGLDLLIGGIGNIGPEWDRKANPSDACYKCYLPLSGLAFVRTSRGEYPLKPGEICFIPGHQLISQRCPRSMRVVWLHFVPESLWLDQILRSVRHPLAWPVRKLPFARDVLTQVGALMSPRSAAGPAEVRKRLGLRCRMEAALLQLISLVLGASETRERNQREQFLFRKIESVLGFMNREYLRNPSLDTLARQAGLAPNYFHRQFRATMGVTPFDYMERKRLIEATRLLMAGSLSVKEVAAATGYDNPYYFSRIYKKRYGLPPSRMTDQKSV